MDSFFGIGISELFFIAIIALIVLGPERLPGAIREVAKWSRTIRNLSSELTSQFGEEMKAFDDLNPNKILRELVEDPAEQAEKTTGAKAAAKPAAKPTTAKTTTAKTTPAKTTPAKTTPAKPASATGISSTTTPKVPTPPMPKKAESPSSNSSTTAADTAGSVTGSVDAEAGETENRILPPAAEGVDAAAGSPPAAPAASSGEASPPASSGEAAAPGGADERDEKIIVDTPAPHSALTVNGKAGAEGDA